MKELDLVFRVFSLLLAVLSVVCQANAYAHEGHNSRRGFLMLKSLPADPEAYNPPVGALVREGILQKFGDEEWSAIVLSQEMHQHIGIYTILGAKMGVYARELLQADTRSVSATLNNGGDKAKCCAADGLQVALGSTFGQGLIAFSPAAGENAPLQGEFILGNRRLVLTLRPEWQDRVNAIIKSASDTHGFLSKAYFEEVEAASYRVWAEFDRHQVFLDQRMLIEVDEQPTENAQPQREGK